VELKADIGGSGSLEAELLHGYLCDAFIPTIEHSRQAKAIPDRHGLLLIDNSSNHLRCDTSQLRL
jgi:hypothetical protein